MDDDGVFRVGLIGYGFAGKTFHAPLIGAESKLKIAVVASSDAAKVLADLPNAMIVSDPLAVATDPNLDLVVIASPNDSHAPLASAALKAGNNVVVDKPFTLDLQEARDLIVLADTHDRLLSVFHNRRWDSDFLSVKSAIDTGLIGSVTHFESHIDRFRPEVRQRWREGAGLGSGIWFDLGPHLIDQALQLLGLPIHVQATLARQRQGAVADDWAHVVLEYGHCRAILHASMLVAGGSPRFTVHGTQGSLVKSHPDIQEQQLLAGMTPGTAGWGDDPDDLTVYDEKGASHRRAASPGDQRSYYAGIAAALAGKGPNPVSPRQALAVMSVLISATRSAQEGIIVTPDFLECVGAY
jgi:predicted dehydrogenase